MGIWAPDDYEPWDSEQLSKVLAASVRKIASNNRERVAAIVGAVEVEDLLEEALLNFMVDEKDSKTLLKTTTFATQIRLAFSVGLISRYEFGDLNTVREVRNHFAHSKECSFEDQKVRKLCSDFSILAQRPDLFAALSTFERFQVAVFFLAENLSHRSWQATKQKRDTPDEVSSEGWEQFF